MTESDRDKTTARRNWSAWRDYAPRLHRFLISKLSDRDDAQDLFQEAYLRLLRIEKPELIRHPEVYLFRIASNLVGEFMLKRSQAPKHIDIAVLVDEHKDSDEGAYAEEVDHKLAIGKLEDILSDLPPLYREALLLRKRDGLSHDEIAETLQLSPNTVHKYLTRALAECRNKWKDA